VTHWSLPSQSHTTCPAYEIGIHGIEFNIFLISVLNLLQLWLLFRVCALTKVHSLSFIHHISWEMFGRWKQGPGTCLLNINYVRLNWSKSLGTLNPAGIVPLQLGTKLELAELDICVIINGEPALWPKYVMTSLFLCWRSNAERIVYIFLQDLSIRKHCLYLSSGCCKSWLLHMTYFKLGAKCMPVCLIERWVSHSIHLNEFHFNANKCLGSFLSLRHNSEKIINLVLHFVHFPWHGLLFILCFNLARAASIYIMIYTYTDITGHVGWN
jgi:hypothetical protein